MRLYIVESLCLNKSSKQVFEQIHINFTIESYFRNTVVYLGFIINFENLEIALTVAEFKLDYIMFCLIISCI
jgi:hypothetical protein